MIKLRLKFIGREEIFLKLVICILATLQNQDINTKLSGMKRQVVLYISYIQDSLSNRRQVIIKIKKQYIVVLIVYGINQAFLTIVVGAFKELFGTTKHISVNKYAIMASKCFQVKEIANAYAKKNMFGIKIISNVYMIAKNMEGSTVLD